ncbi:senecionine N-oxygenase [Nilaparvata lugens]|uniref:senecionine N-oxygenase n=1 Tax=Nilaparvata lugens TaxID=108931 RepID=UPI00193E6270|nr:senecionine N-oxygenase [Nilaparvata lugens]XP_039294915.1 senecionine N-oxygenase [Nilaparvata lugens]XP_039294916.1 senecionine N-oxygenase [Nilaparvata lugens]XP_039294917.1 senecionine N-oxygenase [Nilaparvata lugens]
MAKQSVVIVGAGVSGLCAGRHLLKHPDKYNVVIYEMASEIGGSWIYTDRIGTDEYGTSVHTSMYSNLSTNLPKEAMAYPDYPFKENESSYLPREDVLNYINDYTDHFDVRKLVKTLHKVDKISRKDDKWSINVTNCKTNEKIESTCDIVIVCNGHCSVPRKAKIEGMETFPGSQIHSHDYRKTAPYKGQTVLVVGAGPSGLDISCDLSKVAKQVNIIKDDSEVTVDSIIYCIGYNHEFLFLDESCQITVEENYVRPLYKQIINADHPTMCFLGLQKYGPLFPLVDIQMRFYLAYLEKNFATKQEMARDVEQFENAKVAAGTIKNHYHALPSGLCEVYLDDLVKLAKIDPLPTVMLRIHFHGAMTILTDFMNFRKNVYKAVDGEKFTLNGKIFEYKKPCDGVKC